MKVFIRSNYELELVAETPKEAKIITALGTTGAHVQAYDQVSTKSRIIIVPRLPEWCTVRESD